MARNNPNPKRPINQAGSSELVDFSADAWSWKGKAPIYPISPEGFSFDIENENGLDRKAISLGIIGMIIIVYNAKSATIREEEILPVFFEVIATRSWLTMTKREAGTLAKSVILKLTDPEASGDVFDLCSYAPLEVKRSLLRALFAVARIRLKENFRAEAETRILEDIVPNIFENPEFELANLTGNIIREKAENAPDETPAAHERTDEVIEAAPEPEPDIVSQVRAQEFNRDAETALREHLDQLTKAVPDLPPLPEEPEDSYVPFSDMEAEEALLAKANEQKSSQPRTEPISGYAPPSSAPVSRTVSPEPAANDRAIPDETVAPTPTDPVADLYSQQGFSTGDEYQFPPVPPREPQQAPFFRNAPAAPGAAGYSQPVPDFGQAPDFGPAPTFSTPLSKGGAVPSKGQSAYPAPSTGYGDVPVSRSVQPGQPSAYPPAPNFAQPQVPFQPGMGPGISSQVDPRAAGFSYYPSPGPVPGQPYPAQGAPGYPFSQQQAVPPFSPYAQQSQAYYPPHPWPQVPPQYGQAPAQAPYPGAPVPPQGFPSGAVPPYGNPANPANPADPSNAGADMESTAPRKAV